MIRPLAAQESYNLLEIVESRCEDSSVIFYSQYEPDEWYDQTNPDSNMESPISDSIMDRTFIMHTMF